MWASRERKSRGALVAEVLAGAWRDPPPALPVSPEELALITPVLLASGTGALTWWRVQRSGTPGGPEASPFRRAYRGHALEAVRHEIDVKHVISRLRARGVEPILIKGWAVARLYPERALRFSGDIDLCVRPEHYSAAMNALEDFKDGKYPIDLHRGFDRLDVLSADELYPRSELVSLDDVEVRVLGPEDHLRVLCLHTLRHGAFRPLWLCDIAVALESRPAGFDWDRCLGVRRRSADWVACAIGLAHELLGARVDGTPVCRRAKHLPRWIVPAVVRQWNTYETPQGRRLPMTTHLRHPSGLLSAIRQRWPNPIEATVDVNGPFNEWPRLPFQLGDCIARTAMFLAQAGRSTMSTGNTPPQ